MPSHRTKLTGRFRFHLVLAALLALATGFAVAGCGSDSNSGSDLAAGEVVEIGSLFSTTGAGEAFGPQQLKAAQLAIREVNDSPDVINGASLKLVQRNDRSDPARSARLMDRLITDDRVVAVLGPTFSNSAAEAHPVANQLETPALSVSNTGPGIVGDCPYSCEYSFRDSLGEAAAIPANIDELLDESPNLGSVKIFVPADDPFGETSAETARQAFEAANVRVKQVTTGADGKVGFIRLDGFDAAMITASSGAVAARIIRQLRNGLMPDGPILGGNAFNSQLAAREAGKAGKGARSASAWFAGNDSQANRDFVAAYREAWDEEPDQFAAQAYTGVKLLAAAIGDADLTGDDIAADRKAVRDALEQVEMDTPLGQFRFTPDHDVSQPIWVVAMDGKGGFDLVRKVEPEVLAEAD